jgi:alpha-tubulin suppressor-like RCC1 family protein
MYAQWKAVFPRVSAGQNFSTLVTEKGKIYAAGNNNHGQLGDKSGQNRDTFTLVTISGTQEPAQRVISGTDNNFAILGKAGIVCWGRGDYGKLGTDKYDTTATSPEAPVLSVPANVNFPGEIQHISAGRFQTALLTVNGEYWAAGTKSNGALGNGSGDRERQFERVASDIVSVAAGQNYVLLVKRGGSMLIAGEGAYGKLGTGREDNEPKLRVNSMVSSDNAMVFAGKTHHSMVLKKDGRLLSAGFNSSGQLGQGHTKSSQTYFAAVIDEGDNEITGVAFVSLGENHSMILKNDGTLWAAGRNQESQLGIISTANQSRAVKVMEGVAYVAAGYTHTLAVKEDGTLWAAGSNSDGQLGRPGRESNKVWTEIDISKITTSPAGAPKTK